MLRLSGDHRVGGEVKAPPDKSISHRAIILSLISGEGRLTNLSRAIDVGRSLELARALGAGIEGNDVVYIRRGAFREPSRPLFAGNSGTTVRLFVGLLAALPFFSILYGDRSLSRRPMKRVVEPLRSMGARIDGRGEGERLPLAIRGGGLKGVEYELPVPSAQVKSALLIAGLLAEGETVVRERIPSRDHTERLLEFCGAQLKRKDGQIELLPSDLQQLDLRVPGDFSSAAYLLALGLLKGKVKVRDVGLNPTRTGLLRVLRRMGAELEVNEKGGEPEPIGEITATASRLKAVAVGEEMVPCLIDEIPLLAVLSTQAEGETRITGARELRFKESDRIRAIVLELRKMGADIEELEDGLVIRGPTRLKGAILRAHGDHRLALSLVVASLAAEGESQLLGDSWIAISYPEFLEHLKCLLK